MERGKLDACIGEAPEGPGVYLFYESERVLYVGKAIDIQERLRSYRDPRSPRISRMVDRADRIETREAEDGRRALLLEANLIKRYQPRYNTRLKDGKSYPVIELTDHRFPQIRASRDPDARSMVFGPFTSMQEVETSIKAFRDLYGLRACSDHTLETRDRPCVAYQMGLCSAPCAGLISEGEYAERVETVRSFFREDPEPVLAEIEERMEEAADEKRYERAATLRDYREALLSLLEGRDERESGEVHAVAPGSDGSRIGLVRVEDDTIVDKTVHRLAGEVRDEGEAVVSFLEQFYARGDLPARIIVPEMPEDDMVIDWLTAEDTDLVEPETGRDRVLLDTARSATVGQDAIDFGDAFENEIHRIECFDISHTGGSDVVGSDVVLEDGEPVSGDYRRKLLEERNDDYANMAELIRWRAERQLEGRDERPEPDLLVIDGGLEQVKAARRVLRRLGWDVPVVGIVKPDDTIISAEGEELDVPESGWQVLRRGRDEAHRFARKTHTSRRDAVSSRLEEIDGVGPSLRKELLKQFSMDEIRNASVDELMEVEGVGRERARAIREGLAGSDEG
ncbi:MAG: excinuclease ABC subunit C [Candidatus Nanohaloarchaea archaeon]|nr:excinuclease ABC subunit C [Candidatus Nanohaloarchaea archaeon]